MSYDRKGQRYCDGCGHLIAKAHRRYHGDDYCSSCYPRLFVRMPCRLCGELARFHLHVPEVERVCGKCVRKRRKCLRCGKPLPRAAKRIAGGAVCASCARYFIEKKPCPRCGRPSARLSRAPALGVDEPICDRCRNQLTHRTCSVCRRYRPVAGTFPDGKPYCAACAPGIAASHACPTCGALVPGAGHGRCLACLNRGRIARETNLQELTLSQDWVRELYAGFSEWLVAERPSDRRLLSVFARHFGLFEAVDAGCHSLTDVTSDFLLDRFGVAGLRAHALPMRYLSKCYGIVMDGTVKADHVEQQRIRKILEENRVEPWGDVLRRYSEWMVAKGVAVRTRRLYLSAADRFCRTETVEATGGYTSDQIRHFLKRHPGHRANLFKWNAFGREVLGCDAGIPPARRHGRSPTTVRELGKLLRKVEAAGADQAPVKLLERVIAKAFGYSLVRFRGYVWSVEERDDEAWLCREGERLSVPTALVPAVVSWTRRVPDNAT